MASFHTRVSLRDEVDIDVHSVYIDSDLSCP